MFMLCVIGKDKRKNAGNQNKETSTDEVQSTTEYGKKNLAGEWMFVVCIVKAKD
jgi:hypothetical protein